MTTVIILLVILIVLVLGVIVFLYWQFGNTESALYKTIDERVKLGTLHFKIDEDLHEEEEDD